MEERLIKNFIYMLRIRASLFKWINGYENLYQVSVEVKELKAA